MTVHPDSYFELHGFICVNERAEGHPRGSCKRRGSEDLRGYMKDRGRDLGLKARNIRLQGSGCLDRCELGPVMVLYPQGVWYAVRSKADIDDILESHVLRGEPVDRLRLRKQDRHPRRLAARGLGAQKA